MLKAGAPGPHVSACHVWARMLHVVPLCHKTIPIHGGCWGVSSRQHHSPHCVPCSAAAFWVSSTQPATTRAGQQAAPASPVASSPKRLPPHRIHRCASVPLYEDATLLWPAVQVCLRSRWPSASGSRASPLASSQRRPSGSTTATSGRPRGAPHQHRRFNWELAKASVQGRSGRSAARARRCRCVGGTAGRRL